MLGSMKLWYDQNSSEPATPNIKERLRSMTQTERTVLEGYVFSALANAYCEITNYGLPRPITMSIGLSRIFTRTQERILTMADMLDPVDENSETEEREES